MSSEKKRGLGRGMGSLLDGFDYDAQVDSVINKTISTNLADKNPERLEAIYVPIQNVRPNPHQPRKTFDESSLNGLATSIKNQGILQPLTVEEYAPGQYSIIAGERRYRAAKIAGLDKLPVIVVSLSEIQRIEIALIENIQREDLNSIEEAAAYDYLIQRSGYSQEEVAKKVGKSRSAIANSIRLLSLPDSIKDDVISGAMSAGHARVLLSLVNPSDVILLRNKILQEGISVREAEALAAAYNKGQKLAASKKSTTKDSDIISIEEKFVSAVGSRCEIKGTLRRGKLQIKYKSQADLERIYSLLSKGQELFED